MRKCLKILRFLFVGLNYSNIKTGLRVLLGSGPASLIQPALWFIDNKPDDKKAPEKPAALIEQATANAGQGKPRVLFVVHLFFPEFVDRFLAAATRLSGNNWTFVVTSSKTEILQKISAEASKREIENIQTILVENRGRNLGPFLEALRIYSSKSDIVIHVHSKRSEHADPAKARKWADSQWKLLIEDEKLVERTVAIFTSNPKVAIVYPVIEGLLSPWTYSWGSNARRSKSLLKQLGIKSSSCERFAFPAGGMFASRTEDLAFLNELGLNLGDFPPERGQLDGELHHSIERLLGYVPLERGRLHGIYVSSLDIFTADPSYLTGRYDWADFG